MSEITDVTIGADVPAIADDNLIRIAEQAEQRIDAMMKIKRVALKMTNAKDWTDQGEKPYLQVSGAEKVGRLFGISWRINEPQLETEPDGHFSYTYVGEFSLGGARIEVIGTRSSRDGFFKKYRYVNNERVELPVSEIDRGDIKKSALTNLLGNGITRLLGIRNLTWEDLQEFAGINKDQVTGIKYKTKGQADKPIQDEGGQTTKVGVADVRKKTGTNAKTKKPWTQFTVTDTSGVSYKTFSESFAKVAKDAKEANLQVEIAYTATQYGNDLTNIIVTGPMPEKGGADDSGKDNGGQGTETPPVASQYE